MSELRRDPVDGRWVIIAAERRKRPVDFQTRQYTADSQEKCPFCPGKEHETPPEVFAIRDPSSAPNGPGWQLRVIPNKFPALRVEGELTREGVGYFDRMSGVGAHEVIIETPRHVCNYDALSDQEVENIVRAYRDRVVDLKKDPRMKYILIFKNKGKEAGATLEHTHSQLIALPILPKRVSEELKGAADYWRFKERCVFCDIIRQESYEGLRVVSENESFICLTPFAPKAPFETWILPRKHQSSFEKIKDEQLPDLARLLRQVMSKLAKVLGAPPYNYIIHTSPLHEDPPHYHWHLEIMPKLSQVAGFEWGSGFYICPVTPEDAAQALRAESTA